MTEPPERHSAPRAGRWPTLPAAVAVAFHLLTAAPGSAEDPPVTVLAAGDIAFCRLNWPRRLLYRLVGRNPEPGAEATAGLLDRLPGAILALGDLAYWNGTAKEFRDCYGPTWGRHKKRTWPVPGNHEYQSKGAAPYFAYWGPRAGQPGRGYYSFDHGAWHIIALNSNLEATAGSAQERWLRADLAASGVRCILAFWHSPVFSSGKYGDSPEMLAAYRALYEAGASVVLAAHSHNYERLGPMDPDGQADPERGIRNFVVGTGGAHLRPSDRPPRPNSEVLDGGSWGLLELTLYDDRYDWRFVPVKGHKLQDSGNAACVRRR